MPYHSIMSVIRRRRFIKIIAMLAAGAALNVAVAWGQDVVQTNEVRRILKAPIAPNPNATVSVLNGDRLIDLRELRYGAPTQSMRMSPMIVPPSPLRGWDVTIGDYKYTFPIAPLWPGFAINTLFYAAVCWLLLSAPFALRRRLRRRRGRCPACAYPVGTSDVCTECGQSVMPAQAGIQSRAADDDDGDPRPPAGFPPARE